MIPPKNWKTDPFNHKKYNFSNSIWSFQRKCHISRLKTKTGSLNIFLQELYKVKINIANKKGKNENFEKQKNLFLSYVTRITQPNAL